MASLASYSRIAIKIGSSLLVSETNGNINQKWLVSLAKDIAWLRKNGAQILIISSGAIALGRKRLGLKNANLTLSQKQACAAAGQALLTQTYEIVLAPYGLITAQALLTLNDTENRRRWINAKETITTLLSLGAIPIINENDTVATDEIRYGDNDRLAARVAQMVDVDLLILLSDIDGLYDTDPNTNPNAAHIPIIKELTLKIMAMGGNANRLRGTGTGGMETKLQAAKIAMNAGYNLVIAKGTSAYPLSALGKPSVKSSWFIAPASTHAAKKQWIAGSLKPKGSLTIDGGAITALGNGSSLLAAGLKSIGGNFEKGDAVIIKDTKGNEIGRGLVGYSAPEAALIIGLNTKDISRVLGYNTSAALIHRDNMALT